MADRPDKPVSDITLWSLRAWQAVSRLAALAAARVSRLLIIVLFVVVAIYLSYQRVWRTIGATAPLPPGVAERSPQLNTDLLKNINTQRTQRVEAAPHQFNVETLIQPAPMP